MSADFPCVSIIVPVWNGERYLSQCLSSVLAQTYSNFEVIIVDDGSTDGTRDIANALARSDPRVRCHRQTNHGDGVARNIGVSCSRGAFVFFADADDLVHPRALEILYAMQVRSCADMVIAGYQRVAEDFVLPDCTLCEELSVLPGMLVLGPFSGLRHMVAGQLRSAVWGTLYTRKIFDEVSFPEVRCASDLFFTQRAVIASRKTVVISDLLYYYRQNPGSIMNSASQSRLHTIEGMQQFVSLVDDTLPTWRLRSEVRGRFLVVASGLARFYAETDSVHLVTWSARFFSRLPRSKIVMLCMNPIISLRSRVLGLSLLGGLRMHRWFIRATKRVMRVVGSYRPLHRREFFYH